MSVESGLGHLLRESSKSGFRGVCPGALEGQYRAECESSPCHENTLGTFPTPEAAAEAYLQHWQAAHPERLELDQALRQKQQQSAELLEKYVAECSVPSCSLTRIGGFSTPEDAAEAYISHMTCKHPEALEMIVQALLEQDAASSAQALGGNTGEKDGGRGDASEKKYGLCGQEEEEQEEEEEEEEEKEEEEEGLLTSNE
jgi:hypothetical protein